MKFKEWFRKLFKKKREMEFPTCETTYASRNFTEDTLPRFYAKKIQCINCGKMIDKQEMPEYLRGYNNGDMVRKWRCKVCWMGFYQENVSELQRLGYL